MARLRGPLMSLDAKGQFANSMVFDGIAGIPRVRKKVDPKQPNSTRQLLMRNFFRMLHNRWVFLSLYTRQNWGDSALLNNLTMSGYNFFTSEYINSMRAGQTPIDMPTKITYVTSRFSLNESSGNIANDSSVNKISATIYNTIERISGVDGNALNFTGTTYLKTINNKIQSQPAITIEMWVKSITPDSQYHTLFNLGHNYTQKKGINLGIEDGNKISCLMGNGTSLAITRSNNIITTSWTHVCMTYNGNDVFLYINGVKQTKTDTLTPPIVYIDTTNYIGCFIPNLRNFKGIIDEISTYNRALTVEEILKHYNDLKP